MAAAPWRTAVVERITEEVKNTRRFFFRVPDLEQFDFIPGQFVTLDLPIHEKPARRWRSYSIASRPDGSNVFELCIVLLEGGAGTTYLFNEVREGSEIPVRGPLGAFILPDNLVQKDIYFICTGTGIAPFRSMLHHILVNNIPHKGIYLIFGTRKRENLLYFDEMVHLAASLPEFHFMPTLSREVWEGRTGYVHDVYEDMLRRNSTPVGSEEESGAVFYLCGWKDMINEAKKRITDMGFSRKCIHQELYG